MTNSYVLRATLMHHRHDIPDENSNLWNIIYVLTLLHYTTRDHIQTNPLVFFFLRLWLVFSSARRDLNCTLSVCCLHADVDGGMVMVTVVTTVTTMVAIRTHTLGNQVCRVARRIVFLLVSTMYL